MGLLLDIHETYASARETVLYPIVQMYIKSLGTDLPSVLRSACPYLGSICADEYQLLGHFFQCLTGPASALPVFRRLLEALWGVLHDGVRPLIISQLSVETLCEVIAVMKYEVLDGQIRLRGDAGQLVEPIVLRLMQDAQERLIYRAQAHVVEDIGSFYPKPDDLDYPARLATMDSRDIHAHYFPTLGRTLILLSKVYNCLDRPVFEGIAQEAVSLCSASFRSASKMIKRRSKSLDGELFLIKHLYALREQIAPFESEFNVEETGLDLGYLKTSLSTVLAGSGSGSIFSFSAANPLFSAVRTVQHRMNPKQDLDKELKLACEDLILQITKDTAGPIISLLSSAPSTGLRAGSEAKVTQAIEETRKKLDEILLPSVQQMRQYLPGNSLVDTLLEPIQSNIEDTAVRLHNLACGQPADQTSAVPLPAAFQTLIALTKAVSTASTVPVEAPRIAMPTAASSPSTTPLLPPPLPSASPAPSSPSVAPPPSSVAPPPSSSSAAPPLPLPSAAPPAPPLEAESQGLQLSKPNSEVAQVDDILATIQDTEGQPSPKAPPPPPPPPTARAPIKQPPMISQKPPPPASPKPPPPPRAPKPPPPPSPQHPPPPPSPQQRPPAPPSPVPPPVHPPPPPGPQN